MYENWQDYLKNNTLPKCIICYPENGVYFAENGTVKVKYETSQNGKRGRRFLRYLDTGCTILSWVATGVAIAALCFPVALPVAAG